MALEARKLAVAGQDDVEFILAHPIRGHRRRHQRRRRDGGRFIAHAGNEMTGIAHQVELGRDLQIGRSEEHTSELQSLMRISYAVFCLKKKSSQTIYKSYKHIKQQHLISH